MELKKRKMMDEKSTNIFLVRHGQTVWNLEKRWQGNKNSNLTKLGMDQAKQTKKLFLLKKKKIDLKMYYYLK